MLADEVPAIFGLADGTAVQETDGDAEAAAGTSAPAARAAASARHEWRFTMRTSERVGLSAGPLPPLDRQPMQRLRRSRDRAVNRRPSPGGSPARRPRPPRS